MQGAPTKKSALSPDALPLAAMVLGNVALVFGPVFVRHADVGPVAAGFWRLALAVPFLFALAAVAGQPVRRIDPRLFGIVAVSGLFFAADLASWHLGILHTTLANATLFGNSATLLFPLYGFLIARAWPGRVQGIAFLMALGGAALLMGRSYTLSRDQLTGDLLCLTAGVLYTGYFIAMARAREHLAPLPVLAVSTAVSAPVLLVAALALDETWWPHNWGNLFVLAMLSQVIGQGLMIYALGRLSPLVVGIGLLIQPILAAVIGLVWYGEVLGPLDLIGAVLVIVAMVLVRRTPARPRGLAPRVASAD